MTLEPLMLLRVPTIGQRIAFLRERANLSVKDLADRSGVTYQSIWDWEDDKSKNVTLATLFKLARGLAVSIDELVAGIDADYDAVVKRDLTRPPADQESGASDSGGSPTNEQARQLQQLREEFAAYRSAVTMLEEAAESIVALAAHYHEPDRRPEGRPAARKKPRRGRPHRKAG